MNSGSHLPGGLAVFPLETRSGVEGCEETLPTGFWGELWSRHFKDFLPQGDLVWAKVLGADARVHPEVAGMDRLGVDLETADQVKLAVILPSESHMVPLGHPKGGSWRLGAG